jgi:hypothetical protein
MQNQQDIIAAVMLPRTFSEALHRASRATSGETLVFAALAMASDNVARWLRR